jgi:hypothetical protein
MKTKSIKTIIEKLAPIQYCLTKTSRCNWFDWKATYKYTEINAYCTKHKHKFIKQISVYDYTINKAIVKSPKWCPLN